MYCVGLLYVLFRGLFIWHLYQASCPRLNNSFSCSFHLHQGSFFSSTASDAFSNLSSPSTMLFLLTRSVTPLYQALHLHLKHFSFSCHKLFPLYRLPVTHFASTRNIFLPPSSVLRSLLGTFPLDPSLCMHLPAASNTSSRITHRSPLLSAFSFPHHTFLCPLLNSKGSFSYLSISFISSRFPSIWPTIDGSRKCDHNILRNR